MSPKDFRTRAAARPAIVIPHWFATVATLGLAIFGFGTTALVIPWAQHLATTVQATQIDVATLKAQLAIIPDLSSDVYGLKKSTEENRRELRHLEAEIERIKAKAAHP